MTLQRASDRVPQPLAEPLAESAFLARLRDEGARRYHDEHPFHRRMHDGSLSRAELAAAGVEVAHDGLEVVL